MIRWFNNLKVSHKFTFIGVFLFPFLLALCGAGLWGATVINSIVQDTQGQEVPSIYYLGVAIERTEAVRVSYRQLLLETDPATIQKVQNDIKDGLVQARASWDTYTKFPALPEEKALWPQYELEWKNWNISISEVIRLVSLNTPQSRQQALGMLSETSGFGQKIISILLQVSDINYKSSETQATSAQNTFGAVIISIIISTLGVLVVFLVAGFVLARSIIQMTTELTQRNKSLDQRNRDVELLNQEIGQAALELDGAAAELLALTNQQTAGASEQSAAIHQTSSTINEVRATIEQTSQRAHSMSESAARSATVTDEGQQAINETVHGMSVIKEQVETIADNILALSEQTQQIGEIITTVNDIAEQSNLLALNAAVEAARAGEHGRGFAVVANEVRNLAERSKQATSQVRTILGDIQKATNSVVMVTEEGTKGVDHGVTLVDRAGLTIRQLSEIIRQNLTSTQQIAVAVQQQNVGVEQVAQAMSNINEVTNQNVAANRQLQQSVEGMSRLANRLNDLTSRYQKDKALNFEPPNHTRPTSGHKVVHLDPAVRANT